MYSVFSVFRHYFSLSFLTSFIYFNFNFGPPAVVCRLSVLQPGIRPVLLALEGSLNHWTTGEMLTLSLLTKTPHICIPPRLIDAFLGTSASYLMRHGYLKKKKRKQKIAAEAVQGYTISFIPLSFTSNCSFPVYMDLIYKA